MSSIEERRAKSAARREARRADSKFTDNPTWGEVERNRILGNEIEMRENPDLYLHGRPITNPRQHELEERTRKGKGLLNR
jgi:hypothetical protein